MTFITWILWVRLALWNQFKPSSKIFLLTVPKRYFFCGSFMLFLSCVCNAFVRFCLLMPCCHLLRKGWHLGSRLRCICVSLLLSHWYPGSGVVLDLIDSWIFALFLILIDLDLLNVNVYFASLYIWFSFWKVDYFESCGSLSNLSHFMCLIW